MGDGRAGAADAVTIVDFEPRYRPAFRRLNEEWIAWWFAMEPADYNALDHPQEYILAAGGHILIALRDGEPAVRLYRKLGFREVAGCPSPYARCNIRMELVLGGNAYPGPSRP